MGSAPSGQSSFKNIQWMLRPRASPYAITHNALGLLDVVTNSLYNIRASGTNVSNVFIHMREHRRIIEPLHIDRIQSTMIPKGPSEAFDFPKHVIQINEHVGGLSSQPPLGSPPLARKGAKAGWEVEDIFKTT